MCHSSAASEKTEGHRDCECIWLPAMRRQPICEGTDRRWLANGCGRSAALKIEQLKNRANDALVHVVQVNTCAVSATAAYY